MLSLLFMIIGSGAKGKEAKMANGSRTEKNEFGEVLTGREEDGHGCVCRSSL